MRAGRIEAHAPVAHEGLRPSRTVPKGRPMNHRLPVLFLFAVASSSLVLSACADDEVLPTPKADGGADAAPPTGDGAPPPVDAAADTGPSPNDAATDAPTADSSRDTGSADASDGATADAALTCLPSGTISVVSQGSSAYLVNNVANSPLTLCRGNVYKFNIVASGHPFYIKTARSIGAANAYSDGVAPSNGIEMGELTFTVPASGPSSLFYDCSVHFGMSGPITVIAP